MNANFKPLAAALTFAAFLGIAPAHAEPAAPSHAHGTPAAPQGMRGMMGPGMMGKPAAGAPSMPGNMGMSNMGMMGMMQMCPMMHGMMGMHGQKMALGPGMMMGYGGLALSDAQADKIVGIQKALFRKETELRRQMYDARLDAQRDAYAVLSKAQKAQLGQGGNMMGGAASAPGAQHSEH